MKQRMKSSAKNLSHTTIARYSVPGGGRKLRSSNGSVHPQKNLEVADGEECLGVVVEEIEFCGGWFCFDERL